MCSNFNISNPIPANYNPDEDEYLTKKGKFNDLNLDGIERPICEQPGRQENGLRYEDNFGIPHEFQCNI